MTKRRWRILNEDKWGTIASLRGLDRIQVHFDSIHKNHHADRSALGTNRDEREQTNGRLSCRIKFEEEAHYNAR